MVNREEMLTQANFILNFINEIEEFLNIFAQFRNHWFLLEIWYKEQTKENKIEEKRLAEIISEEQQKVLLNFLTAIRTLATKIYLKYDVLKEKYGFESIEKEYNSIFEKELIDVNNLSKFTKKLVKAYFNLSKKIEEIRKRLEEL